jgi:Ca2+-transporting ATPase
LIVVVVGTVNDWQMERQFNKLNEKHNDRTVKAVRSGKSTEISVFDVLVGDVLHLEAGDMIPVDGIFIKGHGVKCDESSATGESDLLKKVSGDEVFAILEEIAKGGQAPADIEKLDPFIFSGSKVNEGTGTFLVTAVGVNSSYGRIMMSMHTEQEDTPLQKKLNILADGIAKFGGGAALLLFIVLLIKFLAQLPNNHDTPDEKGQTFLRLFITAVTVVVVAVPEGLPLAVTLALAFATTRMMRDNNLVRVLKACETMGNATTVCSDKTGTLT